MSLCVLVCFLCIVLVGTIDEPRYKEPDTFRVRASCFIRSGPRHSRLVWVNCHGKLPLMDIVHTGHDIYWGWAFPLESIWPYQGSVMAKLWYSSLISILLYCLYLFNQLFYPDLLWVRGDCQTVNFSEHVTNLSFSLMLIILVVYRNQWKSFLVCHYWLMVIVLFRFIFI